MVARENFEGPFVWHHKSTLPLDSRAKQAEVEVKVERRLAFLHLSLSLSRNLLITLANCFGILLRLRFRDH